ncbi:MAG: hypothetical protein JSS02_07700 [Planctomycetes bacterium]|nr:hypothetical protein [Planctomycetota bacterium]
MNIPIWITYAGSIALIFFLYGAKGVILRNARNPRVRIALFSIAVAVCIPVTWGLSPDWNNRHVFRIAIYVGSPIATLTIPVISFLADSARTNGIPRPRLVRGLLEWFVAVPLWFVGWAFFEAFVMGWVWI